MNDSRDEQNDFERAIALSIQTQLLEKEKEDNDMKEAIALSLGKSVDQLTARDLLMTDLASSTTAAKKRKEREEDNLGRAYKRPNLQQTSEEAKYWDGNIKLTHVKGFTGPDYIRFEDIVQKTKLKKALVTAFVHSMEFIDKYFPIEINMCIVAHGRPAMRRMLSENRVIIYPPLKDERFGCFHIKLMLLFHESSLRVVIGSANLVDYDYEDLDNVVFLQDFPKKNEPYASISSMPEFARDIADLLDQMTVPASVKSALLDFDFSKAKAHVVASVSGVFEGVNDYQKYGHIKLAKAVQSISGEISDRQMLPRVEMQTSSLGAMSINYLQELYQSFCGLLPYKDHKATSKLLKKNEIPPVDIIYPTLDTVNDSRLGQPGASTICLSKDAWNKASFPKELMHDAISLRPGTLMHSKYIITTLPKVKRSTASTSSASLTSAGSHTATGWLYVGSHNATMSAWGKYTLARGSKQPKMNISNWELGVVLPMYENSDYVAPYLRPAPKYRPHQQAWTQDTSW